MNKSGKTTNLTIFFKILGILITLFCLGTLVWFSFTLFKLNFLPLKYVALLYIILIIILSLLVFCSFKSSNYVLKISLYSLLIVLSIGFIFGNLYLNETYEFLYGMQMEKFDGLEYHVIVKSDSEYKSFEDLKDKDISYLDDEAAQEIEEKINFTYKRNYEKDFSILVSTLLDNQTDAIILEGSYFNLAKENIEGFEDNIRIIYTFEVKIKNNNTNTNIDNINVSVDPFILYISGIDQYGNVKSVRGRSDVNQLVVVNPKTNKILLVNTPRDYYVQLHGTTGLKDKLTHAGIYGIDMSIETLEDLYETNIDYFLRVNFNTLIKVVDEIGGIDIESDKSFRAYTNPKVYVEKGWNHFNGEQALAYSRERYAYLSGDRHRGENQQQVISAIINKVTSSEILIKNYSNILNTLSKTFQTDMEVETMTSFLKYQLDKMPKWNIESISVTGADSRNYTHSMGSKYLLYVMEPNQKSLDTAKSRIEEILNEN